MKFLSLAVPCLLFFLCGCGPTTAEILARHEQELITGNLSASLPLLNQAAERNDNDLLLWHLLSGTANSLTGNSAESIRQFDLAEDLFSRNDHQSVFEQGGEGALAMLQNEKVFQFNGNGQDRIFCCFYKALNYAASSNPDAARTELNRAMEHQENWLYARKKEIASAAETLEKGLAENQNQSNDSQAEAAAAVTIAKDKNFLNLLVEHCSFDLQKNGDIGKLTPADYQNAYITHFSGVFRWLNGDGGREYIRDAAGLKPGHPILSADFSDIEAGKIPDNTVWIYAEDGLCPKRKEVRLDLPFILIPYANHYILYAGMAFPALHYQSAAADKYTVSAAGSVFPMIELENFDRLVKTEYDVYMYGAVKREIARCLLKAGVQAGLGIAAEKASDKWVKLGLRAAQVTAATHAAASTSADTRTWISLPKRIMVVRITRPEDGKITINADSHSIALDLPAGNSIVWLRKTAVSSPLQAKIIHFSARK